MKGERKITLESLAFLRKSNKKAKIEEKLEKLEKKVPDDKSTFKKAENLKKTKMLKQWKDEILYFKKWCNYRSRCT